MQVATLFRESCSLPGAASGAQEGPDPDNQGPKQLSLASYDTMKQEPHDDGYETCGDMDTRGLATKDYHNHGHPLSHSHPEMDHLQTKSESKSYYQPTSVDQHQQPQAPKEHKFIDYHSDMQQSSKENKFIDYQGGVNSGFAMKCSGISGAPGSDPYSFSDDVSLGAGGMGRGPESVMPVMSQPPVPLPAPPPAPVPAMVPQQAQCPNVFPPMPKKRGRKKKIRPGEEGMESPYFNTMGVKEEKVGHFKERKKHDRFNGMSEEEVQKRTLPDHLTPNLDIIIIGINPGLFAAYKGHHYAGPGNHFWKCLYLSGLTPEPMTADDDYKLLNVGIGFTNMVERATKGSADLTRKEIKRGSQILLEKLQKFKPKIAVFNGKLIYEVFSGKKDFYFGRQPDFVDGTNTYMWVMPSSSARCAQLPRAADKVPFYAALKKFRDYLNGVVSDFDESEVIFTSSKLKHYYEPEIKEETSEDQKFGFGYPPRISNGEGADGNNDCKALVPVKQEDGTVLPSDPQQPVKKKRGRPRKIKSDNPNEQPPPKKPSVRNSTPSDPNAPKKKRGRPKKVKDETSGMGLNSINSMNSQMNSYPPHMPMNPCQQGYNPVAFGSHAHLNHSQNIMPYSQNSSQSPLSVGAYHQSPLHSHHFTHSPQPASLTHSDLSSEISAAISSEHNMGSPSPHSPSLGPPSSDYESGNMDGPPKTALSVKDSGPAEAPADCSFHNMTPSSDSQAGAYPGYSNFPASGDHSHHSQPPHSHPHPGYQQGMPATDYEPKCLNQDVAAKSLSGLESLVDQIPSIADGEVPPGGVVSEGGPDQYPGGQPGGPAGHYGEDSGYMSSYPNGSHCGGSNSSSTHFTNSPTNYSNPAYNGGIRMNFSISSLANSSSNSGGNSPCSNPNPGASNNAFSSYTPPSSYTNLMAPMHHMDNHHIMGRMYNNTSGQSASNNCEMPMSGPMGHYAYNQYSSGSGSYPGSPGTGTTTPGGSTPGSSGSGYYSPSHSMHMPSPSYQSPYSSGYAGSPYSGYPKPDVDMPGYGTSPF